MRRRSAPPGRPRGSHDSGKLRSWVRGGAFLCAGAFPCVPGSCPDVPGLSGMYSPSEGMCMVFGGVCDSLAPVLLGMTLARVSVGHVRRWIYIPERINLNISKNKTQQYGL